MPFSIKGIDGTGQLGFFTKKRVLRLSVIALFLHQFYSDYFNTIYNFFSEIVSVNKK